MTPCTLTLTLHRLGARATYDVPAKAITVRWPQGVNQAERAALVPAIRELKPLLLALHTQEKELGKEVDILRTMEVAGHMGKAEYERRLQRFGERLQAYGYVDLGELSLDAARREWKNAGKGRVTA